MPDLSPIPLFELATGYWKSRAFHASIELGLYDLLAQGPLKLEDIADKIKCRPDRMRMMVGTLKHLDLLQESAGLWQLTPLSSVFLVSSSPACVTQSLDYASEMFPLWSELGNRLINPSHDSTPSKKATPGFVDSMHRRALLLKEQILPHIRLAEGDDLLDVAAGAGSWSLFLQEQSPQLKPTLVEQPELVDALDESCRKLQLKNYTCVAGDYHQWKGSSAYANVLYFGALHQENPEEVPQLLQGFFSMVAPGGALHILDLFLEVSSDRDLFAHLFGLNMCLTSNGSVHDHQDFENQCRQLQRIKSLTSVAIPGPFPYHLIRIEKEGTP